MINSLFKGQLNCIDVYMSRSLVFSPEDEGFGGQIRIPRIQSKDVHSDFSREPFLL